MAKVRLTDTTSARPTRPPPAELPRDGVASDETRQRDRSIPDGSRDHAIFLIDPDGRIASWTTSAADIFGYTAVEAIGQPLSLLFPVEDRAGSRLAREIERAQQIAGTTEEGWYVHHGGRRFWAMGNLTALRDDAGKLQGFVEVLRDNTDRKAIIEALNRAKDEAEAANAAKDQFLATISHELRTPLSAMLLWVKLLTRHAHVEPELLREGLREIEKAAEEQHAMIEDLLDSARIVAGKLRLQPSEVALEPEARAAVEKIRPHAAEKEIALEESFEPGVGIVLADALRLRQVFANLLQNAVKFTPPQGRISVRLRRRDDVVEFEVADTGKGISREFLPHIFERYSQSGAEPGEKGLGLGLAIARQLVELHGGRITAHSAGLAKGATFVVTLPLPVIQPSHREYGDHVETVSLAQTAILLVEDDRETRKALVATLTDAGATVRAFSEPESALRDFRAQRPDVILSDIGLGPMSGHEFMAQLREVEKREALPETPALALTAYTDRNNRRQAMQSGFHDVLHKPVYPADLLRSIRRLLHG